MAGIVVYWSVLQNGVIFINATYFDSVNKQNASFNAFRASLIEAECVGIYLRKKKEKAMSVTSLLEKLHTWVYIKSIFVDWNHYVPSHVLINHLTIYNGWLYICLRVGYSNMPCLSALAESSSGNFMAFVCYCRMMLRVDECSNEGPGSLPGPR